MADDAEDFDIVPDDEGVARPRSSWLWLGITAAVALFAFGVGAAFIILSTRLGSNTPAAIDTPTPSLAVISPTQVALITSTVTVAPNAIVTTSGTPTGTPTVTVTPSPTATPSCSQQVEEIFMPLYNPDVLGCATSGANIVWAAYQPFERGSMLWRSDSDTSYVFYANGTWSPIAEGWDGGPAEDRGTPPPGLQAPQRGFGYVWSRSDEMFNGLGWANDQEKGFCAWVQEFEQGFILRSSDVPSCTAENLYNHAASGDWDPLLLVAGANNQWGNVPTANNPVASVPPTSASPASTPTVPIAQGATRPEAVVTRPVPNGIWEAVRADGFTIDGNFEEWPNKWVPINNVVFGADRHEGPGDLSGSFQVGWTANGLMLAVRVNDELYRAGPVGSDMWQGDSIEVQFDRQLAEDFPSTLADDDDYQVGIAFNDRLTAVVGYLWLPFANEQELALPGAVIAGRQGYQLEVMIPWYVFELDGNISSNRAYGFNISVNDNDSDNFAQETVISASPARITHDNPTEWGTLRILP